MQKLGPPVAGGGPAHEEGGVGCSRSPPPQPVFPKFFEIQLFKLDGKAIYFSRTQAQSLELACLGVPL